MRVTKTQSRTPPTRPYPLHKKIKILFLGGYVYDGTNSILKNSVNMYEAPQAKIFFRKLFSCKYCPGIRWKLGQILVGGLLAFLGVGSLFFFRGGSLIFANRVDFTPLAPPLARLWFEIEYLLIARFFRIQYQNQYLFYLEVVTNIDINIVQWVIFEFETPFTFSLVVP